MVELHVKASPMSLEWYGQSSIPSGPGWVLLDGAPPSFPLPIHPKKHHIEEEYLHRLENSKTLKDYCASNVVSKGKNKLPFFDQLLIIARTYEIPSYGVISPQEAAESSREVRWRREGYGPVERIGVKDVLTFDVPIIRPSLALPTERSFCHFLLTFNINQGLFLVFSPVMYLHFLQLSLIFNHRHLRVENCM